jgi:DNA repair exonuclease SbcCD ATPase subunit
MEIEEIRQKVEKLDRQTKRFGQMSIDQLRDKIEDLEAALKSANERAEKAEKELRDWTEATEGD